MRGREGKGEVLVTCLNGRVPQFTVTFLRTGWRAFFNAERTIQIEYSNSVLIRDI